MGIKQIEGKKKIVEELRQYPIVAVVCQRARISTATYYRWRKEDPDFADTADEALKEGVHVINDLAESKLIKAINEEVPMMIMYWLNNRHPHYYMKRSPYPPTNIERLEADLIEKHEKAERLIKAFMDDPNNLPDGSPKKIKDKTLP